MTNETRKPRARRVSKQSTEQLLRTSLEGDLTEAERTELSRLMPIIRKASQSMKVGQLIRLSMTMDEAICLEIWTRIRNYDEFVEEMKEIAT